MSRRSLLFATGTCLGLVALWNCPAPAHVPLTSKPPVDPRAVPFDTATADRLVGAEALIKKDDWEKALPILQEILETPERLVPAERDTAICARQAVEQILAALPEAGREKYRKLYDEKATAAIPQRDDLPLLAAFCERYFYTTEGPRQAQKLASLSFDQGDLVVSAAVYARLLNRKEVAEKLTARDLVQAVLVFRRTGDGSDAALAWKRLATVAGDEKLAFKDKLYTLPELAKELDRIAPLSERLATWPLYRGDVQRNAQGDGGPSFLEPSWSVSTLPEKADTKSWVEDYLRQATDRLQTRGIPVLPAAQPIAVSGKVMFRTYDGLYFVNLDEKNPDFRNAWQATDGGAQAILGDPNKKQVIDPWKTQYLQTGPCGVLFENSVTGTLSSDGARAFLVDDLILPPNSFYQFRNFGPMVRPNHGHLNDQAYRNSLKSYSLDSYKLLWELGGKTPTGNATLDDVLGVVDADGKPLAGNLASRFFLGPPLPLNGKLYTLHERGNDLRLLCLEPKDKVNDKVPPSPDLVWHTKLLKTHESLDQNINRRIHAAHLAYGEGVLVCPTNAGHLVGVDLVSRRTAWVHEYQEKKPAPPMPNPNGLRPGFDINGRPLPSISLINEWKNTAPAIVDGKVVFAACDSNDLRCLDLHDGKLLWKVGRADGDLYLAGVFDEKALIVGTKSVRAVHLNTGREVWKIENTGLPSGQGVASDNIYYLPIQAAVKTKEPEIVAIDVVKGAIQAHTPARTKKPDGKVQEPGNLIFYEGQLISQTLTRLTSYPQLKARLDDIDARLQKDPKDPQAFNDRAALRLGKGELVGAVEDFRAALANDPEAGLKHRAREGLYESLSLFLERDFAAGEKYLDEYKELCKSENAEEQRQRETDYLFRLAQGRESQGRLTDALQAYLDIAAQRGDAKLLRVSAEPHVEARPDVWARGRIAALLSKGTEEQRNALEKAVAERWAEVKKKDDIEALQGFVNAFGPAFAAGRVARLRLAEKLLASDKPDAWRQTEMNLLQVRAFRDDPVTAGRAVEALARLMIRKDSLEDAFFYYRELGRDYAKVKIRDDRTGADLWEGIKTDKRFQSMLKEKPPAWKGPFKASEQNGNFQMQPAFTLEPTGEVLPFFERHKLSLETNAGQCRVVDKANGDTHWAFVTLPINHYFNNFIHGRGVGGAQGSRFTYSAQGHVVVLSLGHMVYAFDPVEKRKLWEYNLYKPGTAEQPNLAQVVRDRDGNYQLLYADGWLQKIGSLGPVGPGHVCVQTRNGLAALDLLTGNVLWTRDDVSPKAILLGDDEFIYPIDVDGDGRPTSAARALRVADGVGSAVPDFAELYRHRLAVRGRTFLTAEETAKGEQVLRLYDVHTGKDLWRKEFPAKSSIVRGVGDLAGVVDPEGNLSVFDIRSQKEVLKTRVKAEDLEKLTEAWVLADRNLIYVLLNRPPEPIPGIQGGLLSNIHPVLSSLPASGTLHAFDRAGGKMRWSNAVTNQQLLLEQFDESPLLIFTVKYAKLENMRIWRQVQVVEVIDKSTGKFVWPPPGKKEMMHNNQQPFHALRIDAKRGVVSLEQLNFQMRITAEEKEEEK